MCKNDELKQIVKNADSAINQEDFDALMEFYSDDAALVVKPGTVAKGKEEILRALSGNCGLFQSQLNRQPGQNGCH